MAETARRGVLITRHEAGAAETAARVRELGFEPVLAPLYRVTTLAPDLPDLLTIQALLVTSANALPALSGLCAAPLLAVGDATAAAARLAGFSDVASAGDDARALAVMVARRCDPAGPPLLLASAAGQGDALVADLEGRGFTVVHRSAYAVEPIVSLPEPARRALTDGTLAAALFFSPASTRLFVTAFEPEIPGSAIMRTDALAISAATGEVCALLPWRSIRVASRPNQDELLALLR